MTQNKKFFTVVNRLEVLSIKESAWYLIYEVDRDPTDDVDLRGQLVRRLYVLRLLLYSTIYLLPV